MSTPSQSLTYAAVETWLRAGLTALGYGSVQPDVDPSMQTMPRLDPGPFSEKSLALTPGPLVVVSVGGGAGTVLEGLYDQKFLTVRVVGPQGNYAAAEQLAYDIDSLMLAVTSARTIGGCRVLWIARTGGAPDLMDLDDADRYHFQTTYITPAMTGF